jgi:hypothetical protein
MKRNVMMFGPAPGSDSVATTARRRPLRSRVVSAALLLAFVSGAIVQASAPNAAASDRTDDEQSDNESPSSPDAVLQWNANAGKAAIAACISPAPNPLHESRMYAMMHLAIHDALNAIELHSRPYAYKPDERQRDASPDAAVASAARGVLVPLLQQLTPPFDNAACIQAAVAGVEADYTVALAAIPSGTAKTKGIALGQAAASAILALREGDGSDTPLLDFNYPQGTNPGEYRFTSPDTGPFVFAPGWADVAPFVLRDGSQFRPSPPFRINSRRYTQDFNEVKRLGGDGVTTPSARTPEQTEIALFWVESSPLAWNRLARSVSAGEHLDQWENARLFGLLNMGMADGYISSFDAKRFYNFWRPITAIRLAETDGNPNTAADSTWTPLRETPQITDHDSGHSVEGGVAAAVLARFFGTDHVAFSACSMTLDAGSTCVDASPVMRSFDTFSQAANENGESRILVGFHFRNAVDEGIKHGRKIGNRAFQFLREVRHHEDD